MSKLTLIGIDYYMVADVQSMCAVDICVWYVFVLIGNSGTSLLLFLKAHVDKPVNSDGMF